MYMSKPSGVILKPVTFSICNMGTSGLPDMYRGPINHYKTDAVRIGIANVLELIFRLSHCSMITELQL